MPWKKTEKCTGKHAIGIEKWLASNLHKIWHEKWRGNWHELFSIFYCYQKPHMNNGLKNINWNSTGVPELCKNNKEMY